MEKKWWHDKVAYQIYPKSFLDTNGDGIGDLKGVTEKLDYLKELGIDIIWLSPIYKSPFVDQGYDIADYYSIGEEFGTMEDFDHLLEEAKKRGMYILMDLVVNHCSDQHVWFQKAMEDPEGRYGGYFYIRKGKDGKEPANYRSYFGGNAWEPVPGTKDLYYLHLFAKEQPDLNWENPEVRREIYKMINWWMDKGLGGFRIDAIINIKKNIDFPSYEPDGPDGLASAARMIEDAHGVGDFLEEMKRETFQKYDAFTVGEVFNMKEEELKEFIGEDGHFSTMFDFSAHTLMQGSDGWHNSRKFSFREWRDALFDAQEKAQEVGGFEANIIENHDEPRGASRFLPEWAQKEAGKKMLATTSMLLRGIPFLYQGQEIGMTNCRRNSIDEYDDISTKDQYRQALADGCSLEEALACCYENSRDNARTPMQWSGDANGGFTSGTPWLAMNPNFREINVKEQESRPDSVLNYYRKLVALRKAPEYKDIFTYGRFVPLYEDLDDIFAYSRVLEETEEAQGGEIRILANYGKQPCALTLEKPVKQVLLSNLETGAKAGQTEVTLDSCQVLVLLMQ